MIHDEICIPSKSDGLGICFVAYRGLEGIILGYIFLSYCLFSCCIH